MLLRRKPSRRMISKHYEAERLCSSYSSAVTIPSRPQVTCEGHKATGRNSVEGKGSGVLAGTSFSLQERLPTPSSQSLPKLSARGLHWVNDFLPLASGEIYFVTLVFFVAHLGEWERLPGDASLRFTPHQPSRRSTREPITRGRIMLCEVGSCLSFVPQVAFPQPAPRMARHVRRHPYLVAD